MDRPAFNWNAYQARAEEIAEVITDAGLSLDGNRPEWDAQKVLLMLAQEETGSPCYSRWLALIGLWVYLDR